MFRPRIIPVLLLKDGGLVKSKAFKQFRYIGDPINAVKLFNDLKADELVFLDIMAAQENRVIDLDFVKAVGEEADMPFAIGGGICSLDHIRAIINAGAEKVIINHQAARNPDFIRQAADAFGTSTIAVCMDVKQTFWGKQQTWVLNARKPTGYHPVTFAQLMEEKGAGEIIVQSVVRDGTMQGYDIPLIRQIAEAVSIPVVALGGAGHLDHLKQAYQTGFANGLAAGSLFVYYGPKHGVLINYPTPTDKIFLFNITDAHGANE